MKQKWIYGLGVLLGMMLNAPVWAEEMTRDQKIDQLLKQSDRLQMGGYFQAQYFRDQSDGIPNGIGNNSLFLRRTLIVAKGKLLEDFSYAVTFDVSVSSDPLRDAYLDWTALRPAQMRVGQFRIPFGIENQLSSRKLYFVDRMLITAPDTEQASSKAITSVKSGFLQERDLGLRVSGKVPAGPIGLDYALAVINGSDKNTVDKNDKKDILGRVGLTPFKTLALGGSFYVGKNPQTVTAAGATTFTGVDVKRDRYGADVEFRPLEPLIVRAEYMTGKNDTVKFNYYYALMAYRFPMEIEPAVRFEKLDPNTDASDNEITRTTLGVNYYIKGDTKLQVNYELRDDQGNPKVDNMTLAQLLVSF